MEKVVIDSDGRVQLGQVSNEVAVTDRTGKTLGIFIPPNAYYRMMLAVLSKEPTPEEFEESQRSYLLKGGWTTAQVLEHLAKVEREWKESQG